MDVKQLIDYDRSVMMYKILHKRCPESLTNNFEKRSTISMRETRNSNDLNIPKVRLEQTKKGFNFSGVKVWNKIPANIREKPSLSQFKNHLKKHLELEKRHPNTTHWENSSCILLNSIVCIFLF